MNYTKIEPPRTLMIAQYLHFIRNARLKSIRNSEWYLPITARPYHFRCRNIRTTFFHGNIAQLPVHSFIMGVPMRSEVNKFEKKRSFLRVVMDTLINILLF